MLAVLPLLLPSLALAQTDWAELGHFAAENAALGSPDRGEQRVVFLGDSITQGWSDASPAYFADKAYVERGISGQTTPQMLVRFRADVVDLEPAAVIILAGTNDLAGNTGPATNKMIQDNLASMSEIAAANGIRVVLATILPTTDYPWAPGLDPAPRIAAINEWIADYVEEKDHVFLDYHSGLANAQGAMQTAYTYDGVHVTGDGYSVMEALAEDAIDEALSRPRRAPGVLGFRPIDGCARSPGSRRPSRCD
jgi:lysophospholipase L1-like esterase